MKKVIFMLMIVTSAVFALDMAGISSSVNSDKAIESVDTEKAIIAASKGTAIEMKDVTDVVDGEKMNEAVDKEKLIKSLY